MRCTYLQCERELNKPKHCHDYIVLKLTQLFVGQTNERYGNCSVSVTFQLKMKRFKHTLNSNCTYSISKTSF